MSRCVSCEVLPKNHEAKLYNRLLMKTKMLAALGSERGPLRFSSLKLGTSNPLVIYVSKWHRACRHWGCSSEENGWTAWRCFPCTHYVPLKGLKFIYSSDMRAEPNNSRASLPLIWSSVTMAASLLIYETQEWRNVHQKMWGCFARVKIQSLSLSGKGFTRPNGTKSILAKFFFKFWRINTLVLQMSTFFKAKEYAELPLSIRGREK